MTQIKQFFLALSLLTVFLLQPSGKANAVTIAASQGQEPIMAKDNCVAPCTVIRGVKYPETEKGAPVITLMHDPRPVPTDGSVSNGTSLAPYVLAAPNQEDGGTCFFMANSGAAEVVLNIQTGTVNATLNGPTDLSERFLLQSSSTLNFDNWRTDKIYTFNRRGGGVLNREFPYAKGFYVESLGNIFDPVGIDQDVQYGTKFNWVKQDLRSLPILQMPLLERDVLFTSRDLWATALMSDNEVEAAKQHLRAGQGPVLAIYNHFGYWHATLIVGYDDDVETDGCPIVHEWVRYMSAGNFDTKDVERRLEAEGCSTKGAFIVRDSIYDDPAAPIYDYDPSQTGEERPYSRRFIYQPYDWLKYLGNHLYGVYARD